MTITNGGSGYSTTAPTVTFSAAPAGGVTATGTAIVNAAGVVTGVTLVNAGSGYTTAPTVTFTGGSGSGAAGTSTINASGSSVGHTVSTTARISGWVGDQVDYLFQGSLDDIAFFNYALSSAQIQAEYSAANGNIASYDSILLGQTPVAYYALNETSSTVPVDVAIDTSGNGNNSSSYNPAPSWIASTAPIFTTPPTSLTLPVINTADSGPGSLRQAILDADTVNIFNQAGQIPITISFNIPTSDLGYNATTGVYSIQPISGLTVLSRADITIDGRSQVGFAGTPIIALDGRYLTASASGLQFNANGDTVDGLDIENFLGGSGVNINEAPAMTGSTATTSASIRPAPWSAPNGLQGVYVNNGNGNIVGTNGDGTNDAAERNVISGNDGPGVNISNAAGVGPYTSLTSLAAASALLAGQVPVATITATGSITEADLDDYTAQSTGNWSVNNPVPGGGGVFYAFQGTGTIQVNTAGTYSFALGSDDGSEFLIDGNVVVQYGQTRALCRDLWHLHLLDTWDTLLHVDAITCQQAGGAGAEVSIASGTNTSAVSTADGWWLLGDNSGNHIPSNWWRPRCRYLTGDCPHRGLRRSQERRCRQLHRHQCRGRHGGRQCDLWRRCPGPIARQPDRRHGSSERRCRGRANRHLR